MTNPSHVELCVKHRALDGDCARWVDIQADPCRLVDLPLAQALVHVAAARRDRMVLGADDTNEWTDIEIGRRYVRHLLAAVIERVHSKAIRCYVPRGTSWGYTASEIIDIEVPGHTDTARIEKVTPYEYRLTWS